MAKASLVITSPGMSMFEALFMKRKVLAIAQTPFHDQLFAKDFRLHHPEDIARLEEIIDARELIDPEDELIRGRNTIMPLPTSFQCRNYT